VQYLSRKEIIKKQILLSVIDKKKFDIEISKHAELNDDEQFHKLYYKYKYKYINLKKNYKNLTT